MTFNPDIHHRRSNRLHYHNYSQPGAYFVTLCLHNRECLFGEIIKETMILNDAGQYAKQCWLNIPTHFPNAYLDEFVIMPNHVHGIIVIRDFPIVGAGSSRPILRGSSRPDGMIPDNRITRELHGRDDRAPTTTLGKMVAYFKYQTTKQINANCNNGIRKIWQRNYYDHIGRNENELNRIRQYIHNNPASWELDGENPIGKSPHYVAMPNPQRQKNIFVR